MVGLDSHPAPLATAASRIKGIPQIRLVCCDAARGLPLADTAADRAHTDRVLQHVADPVAVLREVRRVLRVGGAAVFAEPDWDTLVIDYPDLAVTRAYTRFVSDRVVRNGCVGRQLPALARQAGLDVQNVIPVTTVSRDAQAADKILGLRRVTERAAAAGYLSPEQAGRLAPAPSQRPILRVDAAVPRGRGEDALRLRYPGLPGGSDDPRLCSSVVARDRLSSPIGRRRSGSAGP